MNNVKFELYYSFHNLLSYYESICSYLFICIHDDFFFAVNSETNFVVLLLLSVCV